MTYGIWEAAVLWSKKVSWCLRHAAVLTFVHGNEQHQFFCSRVSLVRKDAKDAVLRIGMFYFCSTGMGAQAWLSAANSGTCFKRTHIFQGQYFTSLLQRWAFPPPRFSSLTKRAVLTAACCLAVRECLFAVVFAVLVLNHLDRRGWIFLETQRRSGTKLVPVKCHHGSRECCRKGCRAALLINWALWSTWISSGLS